MRLSRTHFKNSKQRWSKSVLFTGAMVGAIALTITPASLPPATAQLAQTLNNVQKLDSLLVKADASTAEATASEVRLDGRPLFTIAMPVVTQQPGQEAPIRRRAQDIEALLQRVANGKFDPQELEVTTSIDAQSGLPVIYVNDQWLMTVTTLDAQLQGRNPERWANRLTQIIRNGLIRARQERQMQYLLRQGLIADAIAFAVIVSSYGVTRWQRRLKTQQRHLQAQLSTEGEVVPDAVSANDPATAQSEPQDTAATVHHHLSTRHKHNVSDIKLRLLQGGQALLWGGGTYIILGLFPYTRWLQPLLFSTPLQVLSIGLLTYVVIRASAVLVDQFFDVLRDGKFLAPEASQRLALRVATFSRVLKSVTAIVVTLTGGLIALSVIGVDLIPLLAGAGIIGLAISFASQSIIKDMINGFLILLEDQYAVGDVIMVGEVAGFVENMNLRITQLRNNEGRLITIPNSAISIVQNLSKDWSRVDIAVDVAYSSHPDRALEVIRKVADQMYQDREWQEKMPEPPEVLGIDELDHTGILIRVWIKTQPLQQWKVAREFRRRLKLALDKAGIAIGSPQQALWFRSSLNLSNPLMTIAEDDELQRLQTSGIGGDGKR